MNIDPLSHHRYFISHHISPDISMLESLEVVTHRPKQVLDRFRHLPPLRHLLSQRPSLGLVVARDQRCALGAGGALGGYLCVGAWNKS